MLSHRIFVRDDCTNAGGGDSCEKPAISSSVTYIVLGAIGGLLLLALLIVLFIFHRKRTKRDNQEWTKDPQELDDYGMADHSTTSNRTGGAGVKPPQQAHHHDRANKEEGDLAGLGVPHNRVSVESTQSLARQLRQNDMRSMGHDDTFNSTAQVPRSLV
ncbi:hypothetical protein JX265_013249 [Neoarthrinium moseri]|uniref:Uncharacterized protein n=1 Tax=Neoarthrinium moseri TaxID=1658444 RepID=A0A9P9W944_9PEZI|nr:uncharacterized protein JN550_003585 [Neoarthrinium moseri]KAI1851502.1 hypothetical protein JX265_013249 [Neoarthrinium moseri]KAI1872711.1 hypothetical protein JN550_003585 [Neoarthrinium moseri]